MRLALWLGCFYVLLLSVRPCCADEVCAATAKTEQASAKNSTSKPCADCSPLFSCGTCTGFVIAKTVAYSLSVTHSEINSSAQLPVYLQPSVQEASQSIWQPPQLG